MVTCSASEFLRRYESMPHIKKLELIEGIVYIGPRVRVTEHGKPDGLVHTWLGTYSARTPGTQFAANSTVKLDSDNVPQPDAMLWLSPDLGGRTRTDADGYLCGAPELIVEIAANSVSIDLRDKLRAYRRAGVREYLIWRTVERQFDWLVLEHDEYRPNLPDAQKLLHSPHFPGLTLALDSMLALDSARVLDVLEAALSTPAHAAFVKQLSASGPKQ